MKDILPEYKTEVLVEPSLSFNELKPAFERFDDVDIRILVKFYITGRGFPIDTTPYSFVILVNELNLKITKEAVRRRLKKMVAQKILEPDSGGKHITFYNPVSDNGTIEAIRESIKKWCTERGLEKIFSV